MNKIVLVTNYLLDNQQSMQRYALALQAGLSSKGLQAIAISPQPIFGKLYFSQKGVGKWFGYIDKYLLFSFKLHRIKNLFHICDHSNATYIQHIKDKNHLQHFASL